MLRACRHVLQGRAAFDVHARDLAGGVHAGVGAARDGQAVPARKERVESLPYRTFHRSLAGLAGPAAKSGAVVLEHELELHDLTSWAVDWLAIDATDLYWRPIPIFRSLASLPVAWDARA